LLLYHHSVHWVAGEELVRAFGGSVVAKYHNITPAAFFEPYTPFHASKCGDGREQTARLVALPNIVRWQSDSQFNSDEIGSLGVPAESRAVVPPFNRLDQMFREVHQASYRVEGPFTALFIGRRVPNKGHLHILRTLAAWNDLFPATPLRCRIFGAVDSYLGSYYAELAAMEASLGLEGCVEWVGHVPDGHVEDALRTSHIYLNLSEHEGFCVPLVEAQAVGLPTLSTNVSALPETAGANQINVPIPSTPGDYDYIAGLVHEVCSSGPLRNTLVHAGCRNAFERFTQQPIETRFLEDLAPMLATLER
jgi:glycosyltransferase involved in cell wall biosynthesis